MPDVAAVERGGNAVTLGAAGLVAGAAIPGAAWTLDVTLGLLAAVGLAVAGMALLCRERHLPFAASLWAASVLATVVVTFVEAGRFDEL